MMISGEKSYNKSEYTTTTFTPNQWQELETQVLTFRYLMSGVPLPPSLFSTLFPQHQQHFPIGLGCFQAGYGYGYGYGRKVDLEPGRCKRTDGKKWRCSKEAYPDSKYCEKHKQRGKSKAKKQQQLDALNNTSTSKTVLNNINPNYGNSEIGSFAAAPYCSASQSSCSNKLEANSTTYYPFLSTYNNQSSSNASISVRGDDINPRWLGLDGEFHRQPYEKGIRYAGQMKGAIEEEEKQEDESETQKLYHQFMGDWPNKMKTSHMNGLFSRSN